MSFSSQPAVIRAGLFMVLAMGFFTTNDTLIKLIGSSLPLGEIAFFRGFFASLILAAAAGLTGALPAFPHVFQKRVLWRSLLDLAGTFLFIAALMHMPIANLTSIMQVVPLVVTGPPAKERPVVPPETLTLVTVPEPPPPESSSSAQTTTPEAVVVSLPPLAKAVQS